MARAFWRLRVNQGTARNRTHRIFQLILSEMPVRFERSILATFKPLMITNRAKLPPKITCCYELNNAPIVLCYKELTSPLASHTREFIRG